MHSVTNATAHSDPVQLGRFRIERVLGRGAQGVVYLAEDTRLGRQVAIKTVLLNSGGTPMIASDLLRREAGVVSKLQHPNLVALHDAGEQQGYPYLVFEYVEGESLRQYLERTGPLSDEEATDLMVPILSGLACAHDKGIVHGDLSPGNILLNSSGTPRITDFGISAVLSRNAQQEREIWGSPQYMSPEHFSAQPITPRSDIFAIGMILYQMLTGKPAYSGSDSYTVMYKIANQPIVPPSQMRDTIASQLESIILRALQKDPKARYADANDMLADLRQLQEAEADEKRPKTESSTIDFLLRKMRHKKDFPAISRHITEINSKAGTQSVASANNLANSILRDYSLTTKLLRLVNSSYYGQYGGRISTISRAVVILGFEQVRLAALGLILFEHLRNAPNATELKENAVGSLISGLIARRFAEEDLPIEPEEAFVCSMFHNLGKHLVVYYFPEEYQLIEEKTRSGKIAAEEAAKSILGVGFEELGVGVAKYWQFPERIVNSMRSLPAGEARRPVGAEETLRTLSNFSNELKDALGEQDPELADKALAQLVKRHKQSLSMQPEKIKTLVSHTVEELDRQSEIFGITAKSSRLVAKLHAWNRPADAGQNPPTSAAVNQIPGGGPGSVPPVEEDDAADQQSIFLNGIQDVTTAILEGAPLNDILVMVMETMYRGIGFSRVMLCIANPKLKRTQARFGFGSGIDDLLPRFSFPLKDADDPFSRALGDNQDLFMAQKEEQKILAPWYRELLQPASLLLLPLALNKRAVGCFYGDFQHQPEHLGAKELNFLRALRNQAILAIKQNSG